MLSVVWWESFGARVIWLAALCGALGVLSKTRFARWLWSTLVTRPMSEWQTKVIGEVVDSKVVQPNGGSSLRDVVDELAVQQGNTQTALLQVVAWTQEAQTRSREQAESVDLRFAEVNERIDSLRRQVRDSGPAVTTQEGAA